MASASFASGGGTASYADGTGMAYTGSGQFCTELKVGVQKADIDSIYSPGVDGGGTKYYGFREQIVSVKVTYVAASEAACLAAWDSDTFAFLQTGTLSAGGFTYKGCMLQSGECGQPKSTGLGTFRMDATIEFKSVRNS